MYTAVKFPELLLNEKSIQADEIISLM